MGQESHHGTQLRETDPVRLDSWKEIASFLHRDARTVRRWERDRRLPVHRVPGGERSGVFAYVNELEHWLHTAPAVTEASSQQGISLTPQRRSTDAGVSGAESHHRADHETVAVERDGPVSDDDSCLATAMPIPPDQLLEITHEAISVSALHSVNVFDTNLSGESTAIPRERAATSPATPLANPLWRPGVRTSAHQALLATLLLTLAVGSSFLYVHHRDLKRANAAIHQTTPEAQDLYLRGRYYWNLRTEDGLNRAVDLFTQAIVNDPGYANAYAGLADSYLLLRQYGHMPNSEAFPRALAAARQAIALDDSSPEAHRSLAFILRFWNWNMPAAEKEYRRAIALNPDDSQSHHWYATALLSSGRFQEALTEIDIARRLEPQSISVLADRGVILSDIDRQKGIAALQQVEQAQPDFASPHIYLSNIYLDSGDIQDFLSEGRQAAVLNHDVANIAALDHAASILAVRGPKPALADLAFNFAPLADNGTASAYTTARLFGMAGQPGYTVHYLHLACDRRDPNFLEFERDPAFRLLRSSPEFGTLMARRDAAFGNGRKAPIARLDLPKAI